MAVVPAVIIRELKNGGVVGSHLDSKAALDVVHEGVGGGLGLLVDHCVGSLHEGRKDRSRSDASRRCEQDPFGGAQGLREGRERLEEPPDRHERLDEGREAPGGRRTRREAPRGGPCCSCCSPCCLGGGRGGREGAEAEAHLVEVAREALLEPGGGPEGHVGGLHELRDGVVAGADGRGVGEGLQEGRAEEAASAGCAGAVQELQEALAAAGAPHVPA